jgi:hypothetical protein
MSPCTIKRLHFEIKEATLYNKETTFFFFLVVFGGREVLIILHFPLPPLRGQPTVKCHPRWQPISGLAVHCRLGRLLDSNPELQFYNLVSLQMSHHYSLRPEAELYNKVGNLPANPGFTV